MRHNISPLIRYGLPAAVVGLGALMLLPGNQATPRASSASGVVPRAAPSYLAASPDLVKQLDASLAPAASIDVVAREASLPESATQTVSPSSDRALLAGQRATDRALLTSQEIAEGAVVEPEEAESAEIVASDGALRVGDSGVNMRVGPSTKTGVIRTLQPGEALAMGPTQRGWVAVRTEDGESGWVYSTYLTGPALAAAGIERPVRKPEQVREAAEPSESRSRSSNGVKRYARVAADTQLRAGPSQGTERLFVVPAGERVAVVESRGGWVRVVHGGESGWLRVR